MAQNSKGFLSREWKYSGYWLSLLPIWPHYTLRIWDTCNSGQEAGLKLLSLKIFFTLQSGHICHINSLKTCGKKIMTICVLCHLFVPETMSPLDVQSRVCMAPFHVGSKVCIAHFHVWSKVCKFAPHKEGSNADFALHMEGSNADFAPHM